MSCCRVINGCVIEGATWSHQIGIKQDSDFLPTGPFTCTLEYPEGSQTIPITETNTENTMFVLRWPSLGVATGSVRLIVTLDDGVNLKKQLFDIEVLSETIN